MPDVRANAEADRLAADAVRLANWKRWGPYLSERQWGTVREDYSADGDCWNSLPHDHARSRAYRWGEDGILGITDRECRLCFALAMWNGKDPILKERLFGLTGPEGNHGEDVKEEYFYLDSTPTHSYMKGLYKYPQGEFPYSRLVEENRGRTKEQPEFEISDTGAFDDGKYFDVQVEYAKAAPDDILIRITVTNRAATAARLHLLPTLWFRNTWAWGRTGDGYTEPLAITQKDALSLIADHPTLGAFELAASPAPSGALPEFLFTENDTNAERLFGSTSRASHVKDAFHEYIVRGNREAVNPKHRGSKAAAVYVLDLAPGTSAVVRLRLHSREIRHAKPVAREFDDLIESRIAEADEFYARQYGEMSAESQRVSRQAYAGLLWSKQFYHYAVREWLEGDPSQPPPTESRKAGRNSDWTHLYNRDVISMPDKWEYPWYAAWDTAFHMVAMARVDSQFSKDQLVLFLREWYMHPSGQIPAYEFAFGDANPPVHAWACWRVYKMTGPRGQRDRLFLARVFQKLLINFTWWVNRKDPSGRNLFAGGFLGMDNVGVFDRSMKLPEGIHLDQADGTAWMAFYCGTMLSMALELAQGDPAYEDVASKFFEHYVTIVDAMNNAGGSGLWDDEDGFYYDQLWVHGVSERLKVRSMVGLVPLLAVEIFDQGVIDSLPGFQKRARWFVENRQDLAGHISYLNEDDRRHRLLAVPSRKRLERMLRYLLDESEFLSPYGVRSVSKYHEASPFRFLADGREHTVRYAPGESTTQLFGGNSNWRGPIWLPLNFLIIEALERYHHFFGDALTVECPVGSGRMVSLKGAADEVRRRVCSLFLPGSDGLRPCLAGEKLFWSDPACRDLLLFHEYFHAETGKGLGATHQTGWTALIATLLRGPGPAAATAAPGTQERPAAVPIPSR